MMKSLKAFSTLLFVCFLSPVDAKADAGAVKDGAKVLEVITDLMGDLGPKKEKPPEKPKQPETPKNTPATEKETSWSNRNQIGLEMGTLHPSMQTPKGNASKRGGDVLALRVEGPVGVLLGLVRVPMLYKVGEFQYSNIRGNEDYRYRDPSGVNYSANMLPMNARMATMGGGYALRPFEGYRLQPSFETGLFLGWMGLEFDRASADSLATQGNSYNLKENLFAYGYYGSLGLDYSFTRLLGISLKYRFTDTNTVGSQLLTNNLSLDSGSWRLGFYFGF